MCVSSVHYEPQQQVPAVTEATVSAAAEEILSDVLPQHNTHSHTQHIHSEESVQAGYF